MKRPPLTDEARRDLLRIARAALEQVLAADPEPRRPTNPTTLPPTAPTADPGARPPAPTRPAAALAAPAAAFVTLRQGSELRGCIGTQRADRPLHQAVREMAVAAATRDPRFPPMTAADLDDVRIEISVLDPGAPFSGPDDLVIGEHGVAIHLLGRRGLLLPQVAREAGWDAPTLLAQLCRKAGLPHQAWQEPTATLERFTADVFAEPPTDGDDDLD